MFDRLYRIALHLLAPFAFVGVLLHVLWGIAVAVLLFPLLPRAGRDALVQFWSRILLVAVGVRMDLRAGGAGAVRRPGIGTAADADELGALLLINHTSWLDIFAVASVVPARFVSKSEVARWPLFGWLAVAVGTLFVERGRRHAVAAINHAVAHRLSEGQTIGIFPEGTTTDGSTLLSFHANLIQPALDLGAPLRPVAVRFTQDGELSDAAVYIGDTHILQSLWWVLTAPRLTVELHWLPVLTPSPALHNRHAVARAARAAIAQVLGLAPGEHVVHHAAVHAGDDAGLSRVDGTAGTSPQAPSASAS